MKGYLGFMFMARFFVLIALLLASLLAFAQSSRPVGAVELKNDFLKKSKIPGMSSFNTLSERVILPNFPSARNQRFQDCFAVASSVVLDWYTCNQVDKERRNCNQIPMSQRTNPIALTGLSKAGELAFNNPELWEKLPEYRVSPKDSPEYQLWTDFRAQWNMKRKSLNLFDGGSANYVLMHVAQEMAVMTESCVDYDVFANEYFSNQDLQKLYPISGSKDKAPSSVGPICESCIFERLGADKQTQISKLLGLREKLPPGVMPADKIIYSALFDGDRCYKDGSKSLTPSPSFAMFPEGSIKTSTRDYRERAAAKALEYIPAVLRSGFPLVLEPVCALRDSKDKCIGEHAVVINGYEKRCRESEPSNCKVLLKITNSDGEAWQKDNDDGYVDASELFRYWREQDLGQLSWIYDPYLAPEKRHWQKLPKFKP